MTPDEYRSALAELGLSQVGAAAVLGVSRRTAQAYAASGPSGPASLAVRLLLLATAAGLLTLDEVGAL